MPAGSSPTVTASPLSSTRPAVGIIEHATGDTDVVLRLEQGGGFVAMDFLATQAPSFTLFGNGVVVFQRMATVFPQPDANGVVIALPWRTASLDEDQIQDLLAFALGRGGLGTARESYLAGGIADAPDTIFTIRAGGIDKTVVVNALGFDAPAGPDTIARGAFSTLAKRLMDFDEGGAIASDIYRAGRSRGILSEREPTPGVALRDWPWPGVKPAEFHAGAADGIGGPAVPHRTMSTDEVGLLNIDSIEGGVQGLTLRGPDGKVYSFALRPLLVDETE